MALLLASSAGGARGSDLSGSGSCMSISWSEVFSIVQFSLEMVLWASQDEVGLVRVFGSQLWPRSAAAEEEGVAFCLLSSWWPQALPGRLSDPYSCVLCSAQPHSGSQSARCRSLCGVTGDPQLSGALAVQTWNVKLIEIFSMWLNVSLASLGKLMVFVRRVELLSLAALPPRVPPRCFSEQNGASTARCVKKSAEAVYVKLKSTMESHKLLGTTSV